MAEKTNISDETGNAEEMSRKSDLFYDKKKWLSSHFFLFVLWKRVVFPL